MGAILNGFSLSQTGSLQSTLEKTGQAVDATYMSTTKLLQDLEQTWTEPLHEYAQFASIIKKLLVYRHQKHVQYEMTQDNLEAKKEMLTEYEKSEAEARRLEEALSASTLGRRARPPSQDGEEGEEQEEGTGPGTSSFASGRGRTATNGVPNSAPRSATEAPRTRRTSYGFLSALSYSFQGMMDVDPETSRRSNISKTRDTIGQVRKACWVSRNGFADPNISAGGCVARLSTGS